MNANNPNNSSGSRNDQGKTYQIFNMDLLDFKIVLSGEQTGGKYSLLEIQLLGEEDLEVPMHSHSKEKLIVYVMEGKFLFKQGKEIIHAEKEKILILEKDIPHSYRKIGKEKGTLLIMFIPGGFENFFTDLGLTNRKQQKSSNEDQVLLHLLEKKYGGKFVFE
ncbi:cupin domain-containing protein [Candidatus Nitrosocosmicus sp. FF01]|uniref:cupin domain-containing protein n=1 Tax=Candidatus Nitrosocosmicus sp. FF01 TaxID=3397670 RepID=UPI0039EA4B41